MRTRWRRTLIGALIALAVLVSAVVVDLVILANRIGSVPISLPADGPGETFLIIGSDARDSLPSGEDQDTFGTPEQAPGARADLVLVVHRTDTTTTSFSVPRDLLMKRENGGARRLALSLLEGPQALVDEMCSTLGVRPDHVAIFNFKTFTDLIDALGGLTVQIPYPVRDKVTGLLIEKPGDVVLSGAQALALARSRTPERLVDGTWTPLADGALERTQWAGKIFQAVRAQISETANPLVLQRAAWWLTDGIVTDEDTGLFDLLSLRSGGGSVVELPTKIATAGALAQQTTDETFAALSKAGIGKPCS